MGTGLATTVGDLARRAKEMIDTMWTADMYYFVDGYGDVSGDDEMESVLLTGTQTVTSVCSVAAMRLSLADLIGITPDDEEDGHPMVGGVTVSDYVTTHPLYVEGMKLLGESFYEAELKLDLHQVEQDDVKLLDGKDGRPYTYRDVESRVIQLNDSTWIARKGYQNDHDLGCDYDSDEEIGDKRIVSARTLVHEAFTLFAEKAAKA